MKECDVPKRFRRKRRFGMAESELARFIRETNSWLHQTEMQDGFWDLQDLQQRRVDGRDIVGPRWTLFACA